MDLATIAVVGVGALVVIGVIVFMLNRAWGDFPGRIGPPPGSLPLPPLAEPVRGAPASGDAAWLGQPVDSSTLKELADEPPAGAPAGGLVAVEHPLVRRAIEQAMQQGGSPYALYFVRHNETIYLNLARIADPAQRERIAHLVTEVNGKGSGELSMSDTIQAVQELMRLR